MHSPLPIFAPLLNAFIWGLSWWPFRLMHDAGLHPLWATAFMYALVLIGLIMLRPGTLRQVWQYPALLLLAAGFGLKNVAFNWAVTAGDVVRVILLFYLMPAWAVLQAWKLPGERLTPMALLLMLGNWALQFGAAHLPSGVTSVVMLSEVVFASVSSVLIAHETLSARMLAGGAPIMGAALLAALGRKRQA